MKKRIPELLISIVISLTIWISYSGGEDPLDSGETSFVVGFVMLVVFPVGYFIRRFKKKR